MGECWQGNKLTYLYFEEQEKKRTRKAKPPKGKPPPTVSQAPEVLPAPAEAALEGRMGLGKAGRTHGPTRGLAALGLVEVHPEACTSHRPPHLEGETPWPSPRDHFPAEQPPRGGAWPFKGPSRRLLQPLKALQRSPQEAPASKPAGSAERRLGRIRGPDTGGSGSGRGDRC